MRALLLCLALVGSAVAQPATVVLVRHAEKAAEPGPDPGLSEAGRRRAEALAALLADAGIEHIVVSRFQRTQATAAPLAARLRLQPEVVDGGKAHAQALLAAVNAKAGARVLVVGHSNTLMPLLAALGGPQLPPVCEARHGTVFVWQGGSLLRLRVGDDEPPASPGCQ